MLKFVLDHLKTKKMMCKNAVEKLQFAMSIPDRYKTQEMCDKVILKIDGVFRFAHDCCKNQTMCDKSIDNYSHEL